VIENELALAVSLDVTRRDAADRARLVFKHQMAWHPAGALANATGIFERFEKGVAYERMIRRTGRIGARVPPAGRDIGDPGNELYDSLADVRHGPRYVVGNTPIAKRSLRAAGTLASSAFRPMCFYATD